MNWLLTKRDLDFSATLLYNSTLLASTVTATS